MTCGKSEWFGVCIGPCSPTPASAERLVVEFRQQAPHLGGAGMAGPPDANVVVEGKAMETEGSTAQAFEVECTLNAAGIYRL